LRESQEIPFLLKQPLHCFGQFRLQTIVFKATVLIGPAVAKLVRVCFGAGREFPPNRVSRIKKVHIPGYLVTVPETSRERPPHQLPGIIELPYARITELAGSFPCRLIFIIVHHGNPYHEHGQAGIRVSIQNTPLHRTGALLGSLGSCRRHQGNEAWLSRVQIEHIDKSIKGIVKPNKFHGVDVRPLCRRFIALAAPQTHCSRLFFSDWHAGFSLEHEQLQPMPLFEFFQNFRTTYHPAQATIRITSKFSMIT
jgi:hypothetical protein